MYNVCVMDTDIIILIAESLLIVGIFTTIIGIAICPCSCNPKRDCQRRTCEDCKRDREVCRARCAQNCGRKRAETEEELV